MMWCRGERRRMAMAHTLEESGSRQMSGTVGETYQAPVVQLPAQLGGRPGAVAHVGAQDGVGILNVFQGLFLL